MTSIQRSLLVAFAMILVATATVVDLLPEAIAQYSPFAILALAPWALYGERKRCGAVS